MKTVIGIVATAVIAGSIGGLLATSLLQPVGDETLQIDESKRLDRVVDRLDEIERTATSRMKPALPAGESESLPARRDLTELERRVSALEKRRESEAANSTTGAEVEVDEIAAIVDAHLAEVERAKMSKNREIAREKVRSWAEETSRSETEKWSKTLGLDARQTDRLREGIERERVANVPRYQQMKDGTAPRDERLATIIAIRESWNALDVEVRNTLSSTQYDQFAEGSTPVRQKYAEWIDSVEADLLGERD